MLKYEKEKEKAAFKKMTFKEKAGHIVMYYRYHILIGIAVIAILAWALNHYIINPPKKSSLTLLFHTSVMDSDKVPDVQQALNEAFPELCTEDEVFTEEEMARLRELADQQVQVDEDEDGEERESGIVEAELVTTDIDTDEEIVSGPYPYLINISNNETIREIFYDQDIYVGVVVNATNVEAAKEMIWYLLSSPN